MPRDYADTSGSMRANRGAEYTADEIDFLKAVDRARAAGRRLLPPLDGFRLAVGLGWRKTTPPGDDPGGVL